MYVQQSMTACSHKYASFGRRASRIEFAGRFTLWLLIAVLLHGCASMSEAECLSADWTVVGEIDGQQGRALSVLDNYQRDCADYGVVPDVEAYVAGRDNGLAFYCTAANGYREGRSGQRLEADCPAALAAAFQHNFQLGRDVHNALDNLRLSADSVRSKRDELNELRTRRTAQERSLAEDELTDGETAAKRDDIASMSDRIDDLQDEIIVSAAALGISLVRYRDAVGAALAEGHYEPFEDELIREVQLFTR